MARYYQVSPNFWQGTRRQWSDRQKLLAQYILSSPHRNLEGLYWLPKQYIAADLGWTARQVDETLDALCAAEFVRYDADAEVVFICKSLKYQAPSSEKQVRGAVAVLESVPPTVLFAEFAAAAAEFAPKLADEIRKGLGTHRQSHSNGSGDGSVVSLDRDAA